MRHTYIIALLLVICSTASAQVYQRMPQYGYQMPRAQIDSVLRIPSDTVRNKTGVVRIGTQLYAGNGTYWSAATIDTTDIRYRPTAGDGISITGPYPSQTIAGNPDTLIAGANITLSPSGTKKVTISANTASLDSLYGGKVDSVVQRGDTLRYFIGSDSTLVGVISGGGGTLQEAFDAAPTAIPQINAHGQQFRIDSTSTFWVSSSIDYNDSLYSYYNLYNAAISFFSGKLFKENTSIAQTKDDVSINLANFDFSKSTSFKIDSSKLIFKTEDPASRQVFFGINNDDPTAPLHVVGAPRFETDSAAAGYVWTSKDATGQGEWRAASGGGSTDTSSLSNRINAKANTADPTFTGSIALSSTTGGITLPSMTDAQMNAITPAAGTQVFNTTYNAVCTYMNDWGWWSFDPEWLTYNGCNSNSEFITTGIGATSTTVGDLYATIANSGTVTSSPGLPNAPGIIQLSSASSANSRALLISDLTNAQTMVVGGGRLLFEARVQVPTLSSSSETFRFFTGLSSNNQVVSASSVAFLYDSTGVNAGSAAIGRWQVVCSNGTTRSYTTTDSTVTAGQWYTLRAVINASATQVNFYINGALVKSETNNIPTAAVSPMAVLTKSNGTTARTVLVDYIRMRQKFTTPR